MIRKIDHLVITTERIEECLGFYEALGFTVKQEGARYALFAGDFKINVHIKGQELKPHAGVIQPGSVDLCLEIAENIEKCKEELLHKGIVTELGIVERHGVYGEMRSIYLRDPDHNLVELCQYGKAE